MSALGFTLQPEQRFLDLCAPLVDLVDYLEIAPETTWRPDRAGNIVPNGFHAQFAALRERTRKPFVAHGVGFSLGTCAPDAERRARWLERIRADHAVFEFGWYTDHLGACELDDRSLVLPLPLPHTRESVAAVRASLAALQAIVPDVGFENSVFYHRFGDALEEPSFVAHCLSAPRTHLLLDVHNVYTTAVNCGFDPWDYLVRSPLGRVIEMHISGGSESDPHWLRSGRVMRLDSHDAAVPEEVWELAERVAPLCSNLRGVTLERMEGTVGEEDVPLLRAELERARSIASIHPRGASEPDTERMPLPSAPLGRFERTAADVVLSTDVRAAIGALDEQERALFEHVDLDGLAISALIVARLRFERLIHGSREAGAWFDADARGFTDAFKRFHVSVPPTAVFPSDEARAFAAYLG